jgi:transcriptional regulator with XRE-family HTH domain
MNTPVPIPVDRALKKLGADISLARRRRRISQVSLAERIGASAMTVRRMEQGNPLIPIQYVARALHVFGELSRLNELLDSAVDDIGLTLMNEKVPTRVRGPAKQAQSDRPGLPTKHSGAL